MQGMHVIFGSGPVGCWTAQALRQMGLPVRAVNRSGKRPALMPQDVEMRAADVSVKAQAIQAAEGAAVVYQALNAPYHQWPQFFPGLQTNALAAAMAAHAKYISIENLYMYDSSDVMREDSPIRPRSVKGTLRAAMARDVMEAHQRGDVVAAALRSSDYYGPGVRGSALGEMVFGRLAKGQRPQLTGAANQPHSVAFSKDVGLAAATLGTRPEADGQVWIAPHAPAQTQGEMVALANQILGTQLKASVLSPLMMKLAAPFIVEARATVEMLYEFTQPFIVDSSRFETAFGIQTTPLEQGIQQTLDWFAAN